MDRGRRPPQGGKPSAAVLSPSSLERKTPRSVLGGFADRVAPVIRGESVGSAKHTSTARRTHLKTATRARWHKQGQLLGEARHEPIGRGGGKPKGTRWGNATHNTTPPMGTRQSHRWEDAPRTSTPTPPRRAEGQRQFSRQVGTFLAQAPRRGFGGCKAVGKRERRPKTPRPMGQRPSRDEYGDDSRTKPHRARGYNLLALGGAKPRPRREWDNPLASQPDSLARLAYALRNRFFNHFALCWARSAGAGGERGLFTRFSNRHQVSVRRQPRGSFGSYAPRCKQSYQHRAVSGPLWVGPPTARR